MAGRRRARGHPRAGRPWAAPGWLCRTFEAVGSLVAGGLAQRRRLLGDRGTRSPRAGGSSSKSRRMRQAEKWRLMSLSAAGSAPRSGRCATSTPSAARRRPPPVGELSRASAERGVDVGIAEGGDAEGHVVVGTGKLAQDADGREKPCRVSDPAVAVDQLQRHPVEIERLKLRPADDAAGAFRAAEHVLHGASAQLRLMYQLRGRHHAPNLLHRNCRRPRPVRAVRLLSPSTVPLSASAPDLPGASPSDRSPKPARRGGRCRVARRADRTNRGAGRRERCRSGLRAGRR
jgi:hypothetical protein